MQSPDDPQNLNRYSYVLNSPQNYIDPTGYEYEDSGGSGGYFNFFSWYNFFESLFDLFSSDDKPKPRPKPKHRAASTPNREVEVKNGGLRKLQNVLVYDSQGSGGGETGGGSGGSGNDYPGGGFGGLGLTFIQASGGGTPANKVQVKRKFACTADTLITFGMSATIPGAAALKTGLGFFDVTFNPVQSLLGYKSLLSASPTIPSVAAGAASGYWLYTQAVFNEAGGQARLDRLQDLVSRTFSGAENAAKYGSKIDALQGLSNAVSVAGRVTTVLSGVSAAYGVYMCLQDK